MALDLVFKISKEMFSIWESQNNSITILLYCQEIIYLHPITVGEKKKNVFFKFWKIPLGIPAKLALFPFWHKCIMCSAPSLPLPLSWASPQGVRTQQSMKGRVKKRLWSHTGVCPAQIFIPICFHISSSDLKNAPAALNLKRNKIKTFQILSRNQ